MTNLMKNDEFFMSEALKEAKIAFQKKEVPVGCVIVKDNLIIARAHNQRETKQKSLAHAELLAIEKASKKLKSWRLDDCVIYVTLEPCIMCSGAIINSRIKRLVYATKEPKFGAHQSLVNVFDLKTNHKTEVVSGILESESNQLLKKFFKELRSEKN
jgi:tRNA(Arg) A34 adenosine deaminase TadA